MSYDIQMENVTKRFDSVVAVDHLSLEVKKGEIFCLVGPNAAGKTTTIRMLLGILKADAGEITVKNHKIPKEKRQLKRFMGYLPQHKALYELLTCKENIKFFARAKGVPKDQIDNNIDLMIKKLSLGDHQDKLAMHLSGGTQQRTALAIAMVNNPEIAFLDEPTVGLDPVLRREFWIYFKEIVQQFGSTILITTHYLNEAMWADRVGVMRHGKIIAIDTPESLLERTKQKNMEDMFFSLIKEESQ